MAASDRKQRQFAQRAGGARGVDPVTRSTAVSAAPSRPDISQVAVAVGDVVVNQPGAPQAVTAVTASAFSAPQTDVVASQVISAAPADSITPATMGGAVLGVLGLAGLGPSAPDHPPAPVDSPVGWAVLALVRSRRFGQTVTEEASAPPASATLTSQPIDGLATVGDQGDQQALAKTSAMQLSAPVTVDAAATTTSTTTFAQVKAAAPQTARDTKPPAVSLTAPAAGASVSGTVTLAATASDNVGVVGVQFRVDGNSLILPDGTTQDKTAPYGVSWNTTTVANGSHTLTAVATDAVGNTKTSTVTVTVDNTAPAVSLTAPAAGASVSGTVTLSATASDNVGVVGVQFRLDTNTTNTALGTQDTSSPYGVLWNTTTVANGSHTLTAVATDAAGNTKTSTVTVTVANGVNHPPSANPTVGSPDLTTGAVSVTLNATDPDSNPLTYAVTAGPSGGVLTPGQTPGTYSYTPFFISRFNAYPSDTFTATVSDGQSSINVPVTVPITAASYQVGTPISVGSGPNHVAVSDTRAYITNTFDGTVSVIDTNTNNVVATIGVGQEPGAVAVRGNHVYVANYVSGTVSVIDATNNTVTATIPVGARPVGIAPTPDGTKVYVRNGYDIGTVTVINATNNTVINTIPVGAALNHNATIAGNSRFVYVAHAGGSGDIAVIDTATATDTVVTDIGLGFYPWVMTMTPFGSAVFASGGVNEWGDPATYVISTASNSVVDVRFDVGYQGFAPDGTLAYSTSYLYSDYTFNAFYVNDGNSVLNYFPLPVQGYSGLPFAASPDGIRIYIADPNAGKVYPIVFKTNMPPV